MQFNGTRKPQTFRRSASLNETRRPNTLPRADKGGPVLFGSTITTTSPDTISDSGNGFIAARFAVGKPVQVVGLNGASRSYRVSARTDAALTVSPALPTASGHAKVIVRS